MAGARQRLLDALPEHEMRAEQPHRLARRGAHGRQAEPLAERFEDVLRRLARLDDARRQAERPRRSRNQNRARLHLVMGPVARGELVFDQAVGGRRRPGRATAPRPAPSGRGLPGWRANIRAGSLRSRPDRRFRRGSPRPAPSRAHRCGVRPRRSGAVASRAAAICSSGEARRMPRRPWPDRVGSGDVQLRSFGKLARSKIVLVRRATAAP